MTGSITISVMGDSMVQAKGELDLPEFLDRFRVLDVMVRSLRLEFADLVFYLSIFNDLRQATKIVDFNKIDNLGDVEADWLEFLSRCVRAIAMQNPKKNERTYLKDAKPEDLSSMKIRLQKQQAERKAVADIDEVVRMVQKRGQHGRLQ